MSKTRNTKENVSIGKAEFIFGADALKTSFEKTAKLYEGVGKFSKDTGEAYIESAAIAGSGFQTLAQDTTSYIKQAIEDTVTATKAVMGSKSINEAIELQTNFTKSAFEGYVSHLSRFSEGYLATAKQSSAPLQASFEAAAEIMQSARA